MYLQKQHKHALGCPLRLQPEEVCLNEMTCQTESELSSTLFFQPLQQQHQASGRSKCGAQSAKSLRTASKHLNNPATTSSGMIIMMTLPPILP